MIAIVMVMAMMMMMNIFWTMRVIGMYLYEERRKVKFPDNAESYKVHISNSIDKWM